MKSGMTTSIEEFRVISRFESLRKILLSDEYSSYLDKPLAYWALPTDRRLPLAFLGRKLGDLLDTPFGNLSATPGIGRKKIDSFVELLSRAANTNPAELPLDVLATPKNGTAASKSNVPTNGFDPEAVSEVVWIRWRSSVINHGLGDEKLGRFAPSLQRVTHVIWNTTLESYSNYSLAEIRAMKTHGQKRVRAILEIFYNVHKVVSEMGPQKHLVVRLVPRLIDQAEQWIGRMLQKPGVPEREEIFEKLVSPLLEQVRIDATQQIASLAENRLGLDGPITSVRQAARTMGLTRARVYQLLNEVNDILMVRWPTGRRQMYDLRDKFLAETAAMENPPDLTQFLAAVELFYPGSRRGAAGPLEQAAQPVGGNGQAKKTGE